MIVDSRARWRSSSARQQDHGVRQQGGRGVGDDRLQTADVVLDAALDLAGPGGGEEPQRQRLQVREQPGAQVAHDLLADGGGQVALPDAEQGGQRRDHDHQPAQPQQQPDLDAARHEQGPVEDLPHQ
jgi:hypothetical protein